VPSLSRVAFYGIAHHDSNAAGFDADIRICTPLTSDAQGNIYFGYRATGANPLNIRSGLARVGADGSMSFVSVVSATASAATQVLMNCAPALSDDGGTVYVAMSRQVGVAKKPQERQECGPL